MDLESLVVLLVRLVGAAMVVVAFVWGLGNLWRNWRSAHPAFIGYFLRRHATHTTALTVAGAILMVAAESLGDWLLVGLR